MAPTATKFALATESMLAESKTIGIGGTITDSSEIRSTGKGWSSEGWTEED